MKGIGNSVIQEIEIPIEKIFGEYLGKWGGYEIEFDIDDRHYKFRTVDGVWIFQ